MKVYKTKPEDVEKLIPLYREFLDSINIEMSDDDIIKSLAFMTSNKGLAIHAEINNIPIALGGGMLHGDIFMGDVAYVKPEYRNRAYKFSSRIIREIKKQAKYWDVICEPIRFSLWNKIDLQLHKVWLRRELC